MTDHWRGCGCLGAAEQRQKEVEVKEYPSWPTTVADINYHLKQEHEVVTSIAWPLKELAKAHKAAHAIDFRHTHGLPGEVKIE